MNGPLPYRDFYYPLNVFMHILTLEDGHVDSLHYGLFENENEPISVAQERATSFLVSRLPAPPARVLDAGIGLGTTLALLTRMGHHVVGITPDAKQIAFVRERFGDSVHAECVAFEEYTGETFDVIVFQESSQYIDSNALFAKAATLAPRVVVMDEFSDSDTLKHPLGAFVDAASANGFRVVEQIDLTTKAAPTIDYFTSRLPRFRSRLIADLGLTGQQVDELTVSGERYSGGYRNGGHRYLLVDLVR